MDLRIDDAFIGQWAPKFVEPGIGGEYEHNYPGILKAVALEIKSSGTLSEELFLKIWKWKGAMRVIRHVRMDQYPSRYASAIGRAVREPPARKLLALLGEDEKLPGVGAPTGSTILHFIHPKYMPIIDIRTVETLYKAGRVKTKMRDLEHYEEFRRAIDGIRRQCPSRTLRQIDKALFAYHKIVIDGRQIRPRRPRPCEL